MKHIWLSSPHMSDEGYERKYVEDAFEKNWITTLGENVSEFETSLKEYIDAEYVTALSSGTASIHMAVKLLGIGQGDLVFCQDVTFAATVNPAVYEKAKVVFIDSERDTWNMCPKALEKAIKQYGVPKAVILVHLYGIPAKLDEICAICEKYQIPIIEDAAEALGSEYKGKKCGTFGEFGILSFNGNKIITTSGGGALITKTKECKDYAIKLSTQARENYPWYQHEEVGYNYRLSNVCAGIGRGQMHVLQDRVEKKRWICQQYEKKLADLPVTFMPEPEETRGNHWLSVILIDESCDVTPNQIVNALAAADVESRNFWKPMHMQPVFRDAGFVALDENDVVGEWLFKNGICLPSDTKMTEEDIDRVCDMIVKVIKNDK